MWYYAILCRSGFIPRFLLLHFRLSVLSRDKPAPTFRLPIEFHLWLRIWRTGTVLPTLNEAEGFILLGVSREPVSALQIPILQHFRDLFFRVAKLSGDLSGMLAQIRWRLTQCHRRIVEPDRNPKHFQ